MVSILNAKSLIFSVPSAELHVFRKEGLDVGQRYVAIHLEPQPDVVQQMVHQTVNIQLASVEVGFHVVNCHAVGIRVQVEMQVSIQSNV